MQDMSSATRCCRRWPTFSPGRFRTKLRQPVSAATSSSSCCQPRTPTSPRHSAPRFGRSSRRGSPTRASRSGSPPACRRTPSTEPRRPRCCERRPGPLRRQVSRKGSRRLVPRALASDLFDRGRAESAGQRVERGRSGSRIRPGGRDGRRQVDRGRARSRESAAGCARPSSSSSGRPHAPRRVSSASTSSTPPITRFARCRWATTRRTGSQTFAHRRGSPQP